jgi:hypothetical protein
MADVTKIPGTTPNEPRGPREPAKPGSAKFKELMKVDKSGEGPKKRKKRQEESEEDTKAELRTGATTPEKQVEGVKKAEKFPKIQKVGEAEKRQPQPQKRAEESAPVDEEAAIAANTQKLQSFNLDKVETVSVEKPGAQRPVYTEAITPQEEAKEETAQQIKGTEEEKIIARKQVKKEEVAKKVAAAAVPPAASTLGPSFIPPPATTAPGYTLLNSEMLALFEKMVGQITLMLQPNGDKETTIHLTSPEYAKSMFYGAQITIKEYSTAPRAYNIEFFGTEQNTRFFQKNIPSLQSAFQGEKRFSIHNINTSLLESERPLFHRKEKTKEKGEE